MAHDTKHADVALLKIHLDLMERRMVSKGCIYGDETVGYSLGVICKLLTCIIGIIQIIFSTAVLTTGDQIIIKVILNFFVA